MGPGLGYPYAYDNYWYGSPPPYVAAYGPTPDYSAQQIVVNPPVNPPINPDPNAAQPALGPAIAAFKQGD